MEKVTVVSLLCITLKKCEEVAFPKIKLSWKSRNLCGREIFILKKSN